MDIISSKDNETIKNIRKLKEKKYRDINSEYIIEGIKLIKEALEEKAKIKLIVICEDCLGEKNIDKNLLYEIAKYECIYVTEKIFNLISDVKAPQGMLAVIEKNCKEEQINYLEDIIVVLDGIQDPGNLGTILRTVDSANLKQIIISSDTADCYNPKVVRSTMGAIFRVNVIETKDLIQTLKNIKKHKYDIVVTSLETENSIYDIKYNKKVIVIGNEAKGVSKEIQDLADTKVKIPMLGKTESLNASVATAIIVYEYVRTEKLK